MTDPDKFMRLFEGLKQTLITEADHFASLNEHGPEKGRLNERHLAKLISRYLPKKFGVGTGFIVSNKSFREHNGPQLDLVIYDALNNSPLYQSDDFGIFPIEMVYAYMEIKTTLTVSNLRRAFDANSAVRALQEDKEYISHYGNTLAPRFYVFAYKSKISKASFHEKVTKAYVERPEAHSHGIYVLQHDRLYARQAYMPNPNVIEYTEMAFPRFIMSIRDHCEKMISSNIGGGTMGLTLPMANMELYFPKK